MKTEIKSRKSRKYLEAMSAFFNRYETNDLTQLDGKSVASYDRKRAIQYSIEAGKLYEEDIPNFRW